VGLHSLLEHARSLHYILTTHRCGPGCVSSALLSRKTDVSSGFCDESTVVAFRGCLSGTCITVSTDTMMAWTLRLKIDATVLMANHQRRWGYMRHTSRLEYRMKKFIAPSGRCIYLFLNEAHNKCCFTRCKYRFRNTPANTTMAKLSSKNGTNHCWR